MTPLEQHRIAALSSCSLLSASRDKRMIRILASLVVGQGDARLTEFQSEEIERLAWKYRRVLPAAFVPESRPDRARP